MSTATVRLLEALDLPSEARVDQRIPKKLLTEHGAPTTADKRLIQDAIVDLHWVAALKPNSVGVPSFKDSEREYLEIAVLMAELRSDSKSSRLLELIHRAVPYPVILLSGDAEGERVSFSLAHKRDSQNEAGKTVVESLHHEEITQSDPLFGDFSGSIALKNQGRADMFALYDAWMRRLFALQASKVTGCLPNLGSGEEMQALRADLDKIATLTKDLGILRNSAAKEKQMNRRVETNVRIKRLQAEIEDISRRLSGSANTSQTANE